ncbi:MAG: YebC/PmpR family DNA-binding transcriptional regulator [Candidatus Marinimicrobia bacterium]|nr:YebC/PmpR family DNA-binding transcriptional regulator [Candidatus Neomarinimicrobiota bacterium]|tara:strand:- start:30836 stop:31555 length:720 start_codon:yes stop_codon:yes gene_type:complete
MSGHSKWSTIKRKKGAADAKRGVIFTRLSKDISLAARQGGGDIDMNPSLRLAVKKAKAANMPSANIERAIKKGTGDLPGVKFEDFEYEGYGPHSVAILIEIMTDNKNRTLPEIRSIMTKNGGNLGESGCVNWMFERKGIVSVKSSEITEDSLMNILDDVDIEDINIDDDFYEIITKPEDFQEINSLFEKNGIQFEGEVSLVPQSLIQLSLDEADKVVKLLELIENHDDVQKVHTNFEVV